MKRKCDHCAVAHEENDLTYRRKYDEYWCGSCLDNEAEAAYERQFEGEGPTTLQEQYERASAEKRRLR